MKNTFLALAALAAFTFATPAQAAPEEYAFDKAHTQVMFSVGHMGYSFSHGRFTKFDGNFVFDEQDVSKSAIDVTIDTNSLVMDDDAWEKHLKNEDFFNVEKFPAMTFKSTKVEKTGDKTGKVTGDLTILGVTKPVTLDVTWNKSGIHPYSKKYVSGFSASGTLLRSDFGMAYGLPAVADEVSLNIQVEGEREDSAADKKE